jgi:hypothetical protein
LNDTRTGVENIAEDDAAIAEALGSSGAIDIGHVDLTPGGLVQLAVDFNQRLRSSGGRPTDPSWTVSRRIPFSSDTWEALNVIANKLSSDDRKISPAQVAARLVERSVETGAEALDRAAERAFAGRPGADPDNKDSP